MVWDRYIMWESYTACTVLSPPHGTMGWKIKDHRIWDRYVYVGILWDAQPFPLPMEPRDGKGP